MQLLAELHIPGGATLPNNSNTFIAFNTPEEVTITLAADSNVFIEYNSEARIPEITNSPGPGGSGESAYTRINVDGQSIPAPNNNIGEARPGGLLEANLENNSRCKVFLTAGTHTIQVQHRTRNSNSVAWWRKRLLVWVE